MSSQKYTFTSWVTGKFRQIGFRFILSSIYKTNEQSTQTTSIRKLLELKS